MIEANVVCDSISPEGKRLTTFKLRYPKFIHGEFMTHRVISRNASSSRAVPTSKLIEEVQSGELRAGPVFWGKNQKGMQATEEAEGDQLVAMQDCWRNAATAAADWAKGMALVGAHKQIVNRLLEPFSHINVVATATEWRNFFGLRLHRDAQPEMRALALAMWEARKASEPKYRAPSDWHLPFVAHEDHEACDQMTIHLETRTIQDTHNTAIKVSVARCARVSYESHETGKRSTVVEDLALYERLLGAQPLHASPAEHQATPDEYYLGGWSNNNQQGNFVGWRQYRKMLPSESCAPIPEEFQPC